MISQFLWTMQEGKAPLIFGDGSQTRDFIYVQDITTALAIAAEKGTGIYNLGTGRSYSFNRVVDRINERLGTSFKSIYKENHIKNYVKDTLAIPARQSGSWALRPGGLWKRDWIRSWGREKIDPHSRRRQLQHQKH